MSYVAVGHCPKCGAPLYIPDTTMSISPPKPMPSCRCGTQPKRDVPRPTHKPGAES